MRDLRLIGVDDGGHHLLFAGADDEPFRAPLDDTLRAAARRDRPRLGQLQIEIGGGLTPREVQTLVRAGATAEDVAERSGWSVDKVRRYEAPILAERLHVAGLAQKVGMPGRSGSGVVTLAQRVAERLSERGVDPQTARWDATRVPDSSWVAIVAFEAGGRQREARWAFDLVNRTVVATEDEARWLGEENSTGPLPAPHLVTTDTTTAHVYDVEAEGGIRTARRRETSDPEPVDLMSAMRARTGARGRRTGRRRDASSHVAAPTPDDALPLASLALDPAQMGPPPPARGTHPADTEPASGQQDTAEIPGSGTQIAPDDQSEGAAEAESAQVESRPEQPHRTHAPHHPPPDPTLDAEASTGTDPVAGPKKTTPGPDGSGRAREAGGRRRSGRRSVPSWDDVMFGAKD